ncbi:MAG: sigma 54-interacting transcriptional regulator [Desulfarculaceae bacterium]|nr:sigma 54-interacting transcriptional regulator [Desulfarculaceae bacterium]MCF8074159.1 sigma 54-interacting transcriptional regulator [Desulfarculaceae bacterium]MCF8102740.1 sigma 54-interacting transcriptional regulator [Desulfarculaceae bacterium]MCF8116405.1 sigma 54-interacting transcriptional regulator [Desulfarculaceae bacterium]
MSIDLGEHWATVADTLHDGLLVVDDGGNIVAVNPAGEELTGYKKEDLVGRNCRILNCTGCKLIGQGRGEDYCGLFQAGSVASKRCTITNADGQPVNVLKRASVLKDDTGRAIGAVETLTDLSELMRRDQQINQLRRTLKGADGFQGMTGQSPAMRRLYRLVETVAKSAAPVLIQGQSGTGKELVAQAIHKLGPRAEGPYIKVNCAALNQDLLESELFGHVKGAFTGADRDRMGRFEAAQGGDILLDEVGDLPLATQVKLLRVLEEKEIERVGDHQPIPVDVRIIAATHRDLPELINQGRFREDLFYRIEGVPILVPSLSQRPEDIPLLASEFLQRAAAKNGKAITALSPEAMRALEAYSWPGNVRQLKHAMEYAAVLCPGDAVGPEHLPPKVLGEPRPAPRESARNAPKRRDMCAELLEALRATGGNQTRAAELLGVSRVTVWNRINRCGLDLERDL